MFRQSGQSRIRFCLSSKSASAPGRNLAWPYVGLTIHSDFDVPSRHMQLPGYCRRMIMTALGRVDLLWRTSPHFCGVVGQYHVVHGEREHGA